MMQILGISALVLLNIILLVIACGSIYEMFLRRRPRIELSHNHMRRIRWLLDELRKELRADEEV